MDLKEICRKVGELLEPDLDDERYPSHERLGELAIEAVLRSGLAVYCLPEKTEITTDRKGTP